MADQLYDTGDVIQAGSNGLEVTAVSYQEDDAGNKSKFAYTVRLHSELEHERAEEAQRQAEQEQAQKAAEVAEAERAKLAPEQVSDAPEGND
jgi:hypothetical protein